MKRIAFVASFVVASVAAGAQTPPLPTVDQVLDKYVAAIGGQPAIEKHTSRVSTATIEIPDMSLNGTVIISEKAPNKSLVIVELPGVGEIREATDGTTAWSSNPSSGVEVKSGVEAAEAHRGGTFNMEIKIKSLYPKIQVTARETLGGRSVIVLVATPTEGSPTTLSFDAETGLLVKMSGTRQTPQGPMNVDNFLEDYRVQDGIKMAFTLRQVTPVFTSVIRLTGVKHNVPVDDAIFKKPGVSALVR